MALPGCGAGSPCELAAQSVFGKVPGTTWPTSHVGLAYFVAMLAAWSCSRTRGPSPGLQWLARLGALGSAAFLFALFSHRYFCAYCLAAHAGNLLFWICLERAAGTRPRWDPQAAVAVCGFVVVTTLLLPLEIRQRTQVREQAVTDIDESVAEILESPTAETPNLFIGRHVTGADPAALRIVVFSDYQCQVCQQVEEEIARALGERDDVALSAKHFPLCSDCNVYARKRGINIHPNACNAAMVSEAAAVVGGSAGFWKVHKALFARGGGFTPNELDGMIGSWGYDVTAFRAAMGSDEVRRAVERDIDEGVALGLHFTPMIFINGGQVRGVNQPGMVTRAIEKITAANPPRRSWAAADDRPAAAEEKLFEDWVQVPEVALPPDEFAWPFGETGPGVPVSVVVWGDYQEPNTRKVDEILRTRVERQGGIQYTFRHYPFDDKCNPNVTRSPHQQACLAARAVEAAGQLGGPEGWANMHRWVWPNYARFNRDNFGKVARGFGFDSETFLATLDTPEVNAALQEDVDAGFLLKLNSIPAIYINGKRLPRWSLNEEPQLDAILDRIAGPAAE